MNKYFFAFTFTIAGFICNGQKFKGQWKGEFIDKSTSNGFNTGDKCDYVIELEVNGGKVTGASYTYFTENGIRFYTICKLEGFVDLKKKYLEIKEIERTKTNIPSNIRNCFQVHKLTYFKKGDTETIEGNWVPAPNQEGTCGYGSTVLTRRSLLNTYPGAYAKANKINEIKTQSLVNTNNNSNKGFSKSKTVSPEKNNPIVSAPHQKDNSELNNNKDSDKSSVIKEIEVTKNEKLEKRKNTLLKTIEVESNTIKVDLYDNGEVDGDSISLFYNGKLLLSNKRLTEKAITFLLKVDDNISLNELVMYAENLGSYPPNTALMVVTDGPNRYEIRITSDLEKSGVIHFNHKH